MKMMSVLLCVQDMEKARKFYETLFLQRVEMDLGANVSFASGFALQTKETWAQFIEKPESDIRFGNCDAELYFEEDDLDAFMERLRSAQDIRLVHDVKEQPWGQRCCRLFDPDGHIIEVGEAMPVVIRRFFSQGMSETEIAQRTMYPIPFIRTCKP